MTSRLTDAAVSALYRRVLEKTGSQDIALMAVYDAGLPPRVHKRRPPSPAHVQAVQRRAAPILAAVALLRGVPVAQLKGHDNRHMPSRARHEVVWFLRQQTPPMSYPDIAVALGQANHTTQITAYRIVEERCAVEMGLREELLGLVGTTVRRAA